MGFKVGQKVVCVDSSKQPHTVEELAIDCPNWVKKGETYTIRAIQDFDFVTGLLLEELTNPIKFFKSVNKALEPTFKLSRFRALKQNEVTIVHKNEILTN